MKKASAKARRAARERYSIPIIVEKYVPKRDDVATLISSRALQSRPLYSWTPSRIQGGKFLDDDETLPSGSFVRSVETLPGDKLQSNLKRFLQAMEAVLAGVPSTLASYYLDSVELEVEVSAEGSVGLILAGGKLGGKGSLKLKLQHRPPAA